MMLFLFNLNNMVFYTESDWRGVMNRGGLTAKSWQGLAKEA
ncbi:alpha/beta hydrolase, partial [Salmonella enterica subsp. enterica serovar Newport]